MEILRVLLWGHIIMGSIGLVSGSVNMICKKGTMTHKIVGKIFYISLGIAMVLSIPISIDKSNHFLFIIAIWTLYMLITGVRALHILSSNKVKMIDWVITGAMAIFGFALLIIAFRYFIHSQIFGSVPLVFGIISMFFVRNDISYFKTESGLLSKSMSIHIQRMAGAFISSTTAFLVVNNTILPSVLAWLLPTILLVPVLVYWSNKWKPTKN